MCICTYRPTINIIISINNITMAIIGVREKKKKNVSHHRTHSDNRHKNTNKKAVPIINVTLAAICRA